VAAGALSFDTADVIGGSGFLVGAPAPG